jgi:hypothetical protein
VPHTPAVLSECSAHMHNAARRPSSWHFSSTQVVWHGVCWCLYMCWFVRVRCVRETAGRSEACHPKHSMANVQVEQCRVHWQAQPIVPQRTDSLPGCAVLEAHALPATSSQQQPARYQRALLQHAATLVERYARGAPPCCCSSIPAFEAPSAPRAVWCNVHVQAAARVQCMLQLAMVHGCSPHRGSAA